MDYITAIESVCPKLKEEDAMELRADINSLLRKAKVPKDNLTKQERIGLSQLKKDKDRVILTADKGVAMVVMDREDYNNKAQELLNIPAYRSLPRDPTNKIKAQLITKLRIKKDGNLDEGMYRTMYPTGCVLPKFYGLPKIHKTGNLLRPIVSSRGSVTYGVAKVISKVLKLLVANSPHHIQSTGDFVSKAKRLTLQAGECLSSYDVTSLFTSVPIDPALNIIKDLLEKDEKLNDRTVLSVQDIIELLGFFYTILTFLFKTNSMSRLRVRQWNHHGAQLLPIYSWKILKEKPLCLLVTPRAWFRFMDDTWVIQKQAHKQAFLDHINSIDPAIKFTVEGNQDNGAIPFLDTLATPLAEKSLSFKV